MKKQVITIALAGILALGAVGCASPQQEATNSQPKQEEKTEQVVNTVSWIDVQTAADAAKGAGINGFGVPDTITLNNTVFASPKFSYAGGVAQATYESGAMALVVRKADGSHTAPLTDRDKTGFANKWTENYEALDTTLYGTANGAATVMTWTDGTADYGVTFQGLGGEEVAMNSEEAAAVVKAIKEANATPAANANDSDASNSDNSNAANSNGTKSNASGNAGSNATANASTSTNTGADSSSTGESSNTGTTTSGNTGTSTSGNSNGFDVSYSANDAIRIACDYAGAGGQAKGEAQNLTCSDPVTGGGTVYYIVKFNLGDVSYEVQVDATNGSVIGGYQTFNGSTQLLDDSGDPIPGTEVDAN